jgi:hypothetical protein
MDEAYSIKGFLKVRNEGMVLVTWHLKKNWLQLASCFKVYKIRFWQKESIDRELRIIK